MGTISEIQAALDAVEHADTQLEELAALAELNRLVRSKTSISIGAALSTYNPTLVAKAVGMTRQAMTKYPLRSLA